MNKLYLLTTIMFTQIVLTQAAFAVVQPLPPQQPENTSPNPTTASATPEEVVSKIMQLRDQFDQTNSKITRQQVVNDETMRFAKDNFEPKKATSAEELLKGAQSGLDNTKSSVNALKQEFQDVGSAFTKRVQENPEILKNPEALKDIRETLGKIEDKLNKSDVDVSKNNMEGSYKIFREETKNYDSLTADQRKQLETTSPLEAARAKIIQDKETLINQKGDIAGEKEKAASLKEQIGKLDDPNSKNLKDQFEEKLKVQEEKTSKLEETVNANEKSQQDVKDQSQRIQRGEASPDDFKDVNKSLELNNARNLVNKVEEFNIGLKASLSERESDLQNQLKNATDPTEKAKVETEIKTFNENKPKFEKEFTNKLEATTNESKELITKVERGELDSQNLSQGINQSIEKNINQGAIGEIGKSVAEGYQEGMAIVIGTMPLFYMGGPGGLDPLKLIGGNPPKDALQGQAGVQGGPEGAPQGAEGATPGGAAQPPAEGQPAAPGWAAQPQAPDRELPQAPDRELPQAPDRELPQASDRELPQASDRELPQAPDRELPQAPDRELPQAPDRELPQASDRELPQASDRELPQASDRELPQASDM